MVDPFLRNECRILLLFFFVFDLVSLVIFASHFVSSALGFCFRRGFAFRIGLLSLFGPAWCLRSASFGDGICLQVLEDPRGWPLGVLRMGENRTVHTVKRKVQKKSKRHWCVAL